MIFWLGRLAEALVVCVFVVPVLLFPFWSFYVLIQTIRDKPVWPLDD